MGYYFEIVVALTPKLFILDILTANLFIYHLNKANENKQQQKNNKKIFVNTTNIENRKQRKKTKN